MNFSLHLLLLATFLMLSCDSNTSDNLSSAKPNIIFIMADDLGYADLGCYGQKIIKTPHIDQMAAEGMRFTQCYAGSTVCAPSRSVLMTGKHTGHTTVRGNFGTGGVVGLGGGAGRIPLQETDTTIAEVLKKAGYATGMIGKWGLGEPNTSGHPNLRGFDEFFGYLNQRRAHTYYPEFIWKNEEKAVLEGNQNEQRKDYVHDHFLTESLDFIKRHKEHPFFLYLPITLPHDDYEIPDLGIYRDSTHWTEDERTYAAMVTRMDEEVGRIVQTLKSEGIDKNTIVFFCSDNGAAQRWEGRFDSSGQLRGRKRDMYEGGLRTPMIVRYPGKISEGKTNDRPWYFADVLPTLASIAGAKAPEGLDGIDISNLLGISDKADVPQERTFYWEFYEGGFQQAFRWKNWKGVLRSWDAEWEVYNLATDLSEQNNIAAEQPEVAAKMAVIAKKEHSPSPFFKVIKRDTSKAKLFIIGDSTVKYGGKEDELDGWGDYIRPYFDTTIIIENLARGGRSSRTFYTEGLWGNVAQQLRAGDFVLMQFGHNDGGPIDKDRARGSLKGTGNESKHVVIESNGRKEEVFTYGWYLRKMISAAKGRGATPIVLSMIPRNRWDGEKVVLANADYGKWAQEIAAEQEVPFIPLNDMVAKKYETIGKEKVGPEFFPVDHTHTTIAGAKLNAETVVEGIRLLSNQKLKTYLVENQTNR